MFASEEHNTKQVCITAYTLQGSKQSQALRQTHQVEHSQKSVDSIEMWLEQILTVHLRFITYTDNIEKEQHTHTYIGRRGT